jgi:hypothetical protein
MPAPELERQIALHLDGLARAANSAHAIRTHEANLRPTNSWREPNAMPAPELERQITFHLDELARAANSAHAIRTCDADLRPFLAYPWRPDLPCDARPSSEPHARL